MISSIKNRRDVLSDETIKRADVSTLRDKYARHKDRRFADNFNKLRVQNLCRSGLAYNIVSGEIWDE